MNKNIFVVRHVPTGKYLRARNQFIAIWTNDIEGIKIHNTLGAAKNAINNAVEYYKVDRDECTIDEFKLNRVKTIDVGF